MPKLFPALFICVLFYHNAFSQEVLFEDSFSDGNFNANPVWTGQNNLGNTDPQTLWEITTDPFRLKSREQSSGSGTRISYLTSAFSNPLNLTEQGHKWKFKIRNAFTVSSSSLGSSNNARVYLFSNNANLNEDLNGYYIQLREEKISLVRQTGGSTSTINLSGSDVVITAESEVSVEVTRTKEGKWEVIVNETSQGTANDATHTTANFIGVQIRYSSNARSALFTFDAFEISILPVDTSILSIVSSRQVGQNSVGITFNQALSGSTATITGNYRGNFNITSPFRANINTSNTNEVILEFQNLSNLKYTFTINGVTNVAGNAIAANLTTSIKISKTIPKGSIIINEIMADPTPAVGLAEEEYLELYNTSALPIDLQNFSLPGYGGTLNTFVLNAGSYLVLTKAPNLFNADILVVSSGALTNDGELLQLLDDTGNLIDEVDYKSSWYTQDFVGDGRSLEKINPTLECSGASNWGSSKNNSGGTPGFRNSIFNDTKDTTPPKLVSFNVSTPTLVSLTLSEAVKTSDVTITDFVFNNNTPSIASVALPSSLSSTINVTLATALVSESNYSFTIRNIPDCEGNIAADTTVNFYYDITPPRLEDLIIRSYRQLELIFSEPLRTSSAGTSAFRINDSIPPTSRVINGNIVTLNFSTPFIEGRGYKLSIKGIEDLSLNKLIVPVEQEFTFTDDVASLEVVSSNTIDLTFRRSINIALSNQLVNFSIAGQNPVSIVTFPDNSTKFRLIFNQYIAENKSLELFISNIIGATNIRMVTPARAFEYDTRAPTPVSLSVVNSTELLVLFNEPLDPISSEINNNYVIDAAAISAKLQTDRKSVLLKFAAAFPQEVSKRLSINGVKDVRGNMMSRTTNLNFIYDTQPPKVISAVHFDPKTIEVTFSEEVDSLIVNLMPNFTLDGLSPAKIVRLPYSKNTVRCTFGAELAARDSARFEVRSIKDTRGNIMNNSFVTFINTRVGILSDYMFTNDSTLVLQFSKNLVRDQNSSVGLSGLSTSAVDIIENRATVVVKPKLKDGSVYMLTTSKMKGANNDSIVDFSGEVTFVSSYKNLLIVDPQIIELEFSVALERLTKNNFFFDLPIVTITQSTSNPNKVKIYLERPLVEGVSYTLSWTNITDSFGRPIVDYGTDFIFDRIPPKVVSIKQLLTDQIIITFSEKIDPSTALAYNHYVLDSIPFSPISSVLLADTTVMIGFDKPFKDRRSYKFTIRRIKDIAGNIMADAVFDYTYIEPYKAKPGDLIINEIMADPDPARSLPNAEFIEIHNTSQEVINLFNVHFSDNLSNQLLGNFEILPDEYIIVCDDAFEVAFQSFGKVLALKSFPSLGNSEDQLALKVDGITIDSVHYQSSWYRSTTKDDGGWSLERIGLNNGCSTATNWIAALDSLGGTPAKINSATTSYKDEIIPEVSSVNLSNASLIIVQFSEPIDPSTIADQNFIFDVSFEKIDLNAANTQARITLLDPIQKGIIYTIKIDSIKDCSGNAISKSIFEIGIGEKPKFNQLLITEIMADPEPAIGLPEAEYIEIYNPTDLLLSTENISFADNTSVVNLPKFNIRPKEYIILAPTSSVAELSKFGKTLGVPNWPTLNNTGETLSFRIFESLIFSTSYSPEWYKSVSKQDGGYSLEMIDPTNPCGESNNWTASNGVLGGTPGLENSVNAINPDNLGPIIIQTITSKTDGIVVHFNEKITPELPIGDFTFNPSLTVRDLFLNANYKSVSVLFNETIEPNIKYSLRAKNIRDCLGNKTENGIESSFVLPVIAEKGEVLINEILFNPLTGGSDFVEIINPTDNYYSLKGWTTTNNPTGNDTKSITTEDYILEPRQLLVLTPSPANIISNYPLGDASTFLSATLPTLADSEGRIIIKRADGEVLDDFSYLDDYHNALLKDDEGVSLERISLKAPTNDKNNWQSAASSVGYATPGRVNSQSREIAGTLQSISINPKVFVPGSNISFTTISYKDENAGSFASFLIYDARGQLVKTLAENQLLAADGFLTWDGTNNTGSKVNVGMYILVVELFNSNGNVQVLKETVVVGGTF